MQGCQFNIFITEFICTDYLHCRQFISKTPTVTLVVFIAPLLYPKFNANYKSSRDRWMIKKLLKTFADIVEYSTR